MEWTPNELADVLRSWSGNREQLWAAANMLRQQENKIEVLETNFKLEKNIANAQFLYIKELEKKIDKLNEQIEDCTCQGGHSEAYLKAKGKL
jgi:hypothetical protein